MKKYSSIRWFVSQTIAYILKRRRFISLSFPSSKNHLIFDTHEKSLFRIFGRGTEDVVSIIQVFISEFYNLKMLGSRFDNLTKKYDDLVKEGKIPLIIDCGANIGLSSLFFSMSFPLAKVIAIEPDRGNCEFSNLNTADRNVEVLRAAIGSQEGTCRILDNSVSSNSFRIEMTSDRSESIDVLTVESIIDRYGAESSPFIIKIDIEGFEDDLFSKNTDWVNRFDLLIIELHDWMLPAKGSSVNFLKVISREHRDFQFYNENIFSIKN
jgi:FkbM family methyltransferase